MKDTQESVAAFITGHGVELKDVESLGEQQSDDGWRHFAYEMTLTNRYDQAQKPFTFSFMQGLGHTEPPTRVDLVASLLSDAACVLDRSFEEFADDLGYDSDSRKAEKLYNEIIKNNGKLRRLFRCDVATLVEKWEPLRDEAGL